MIRIKRKESTVKIARLSPIDESIIREFAEENELEIDEVFDELVEQGKIDLFFQDGCEIDSVTESIEFYDEIEED